MISGKLRAFIAFVVFTLAACGDRIGATSSDAAADIVELDDTAQDVSSDVSPDVAPQQWRVYMLSPSTETTVHVNGESRVTLYIVVDSPLDGVGHINGIIWVREGGSDGDLRAPPTSGTGFPSWLGVCNLRQASVDGDAGISFGKSNAVYLGDRLGIKSMDWAIHVSRGPNRLEMTCNVQSPPDPRTLTMGVQEARICSISLLDLGNHPCPEGPTWVEPALRWQGGAEIERPSSGITMFHLIPGQ